MPYHRGDYVGGSNYYRGDPFLGALGGLVAGAAGKLIGKGASWLGKQIAGSPKMAVAATGVTMLAPKLPILLDSRPGIQIGGTTINPLAALPGGAPLFQPTSSVASNGSCGRPGYHLNKQDGKYGPRGTYCVRNRKMNPLNPRALKRGLRRAEGFEAFAKRTLNALYKTSGGTRVRKFKKCK